MPASTLPSLVPARRVRPPRFAVEQADGGYRVLAIWPRLWDAWDAVAVATVSDKATARSLANLLNDAWRGCGPALLDPSEISGLPAPVQAAVWHALDGCPPGRPVAGISQQVRQQTAQFAALFPTRQREGGSRGGPVLTPWQASHLHAGLLLLGDQIRSEELPEHDEQVHVDVDEQAGYMAELPPMILRGRARGWWEHLVVAFYDLAADLEAGALPVPACVAEDVVLAVALDWARETGHDQDDVFHADVLPPSSFDDDWRRVDRLVGHRELFDEPVGRRILKQGPANPCHPDRWFEPLPGQPPRDPARLG
jgi:hypothetical protein